MSDNFWSIYLAMKDTEADIHNTQATGQCNSEHDKIVQQIEQDDSYLFEKIKNDHFKLGAPFCYLDKNHPGFITKLFPDGTMTLVPCLKP